MLHRFATPTRFTLALVAFAAFSFQTAAAQESTSAEEQTQLERFETASGAVIVKGFSEIDDMRGRYRNQVTVSARELLNAMTNERQYGIMVQVKDPDRQSARSYVDYDEIDDLLAGIDYISRVDPSVTELDDFQADYTTKGNLELSTFSSNGKIMWAVRVGRIGTETAYFDIEKMPQFRAMIEAAKGKVDSVRQ